MWLGKCMIIFFTALSVNSSYNIALKKPTKQSGVLEEGTSQRAVDGNTYAAWDSSSCATTNFAPLSWWCVDLQHVYNLTSIRIYGQRDYENLGGFKISLSYRGGCDESGFQSANLCYKNRYRSDINVNIHGCNQSLNSEFRAKTIYISRKDMLGMCEVEVYSDSCPSPLCKEGSCNSTTGECSECVSGYYGSLCQKTCERCKTCDKEDGECDLDCSDGFWGRQCQNDCSSLCLHGRCEPLSGHCKGCRFGRYGNFCEQICPECSQSCQQSDGTCRDVCKEKTWGPLCEHKCSNRCKNGLCDAVTGRCQACNDRYYGDTCENTCSSCKMSCDQITGVCFGGCAEGFWGRFCRNNCPVTCNPGGCSRSDGVCVNGCKKGWHQSICDTPCSENCLGGCRQMDGICDSCLTGRYGPYCKKSCSNCKHGGCTRSNGVCFGGCINGAWGANCSSTCGERCKDGCLQSFGECIDCAVGTFGNFCSRDCFTCNDDGCRRTDGVCHTGCRIGWYGDRCDKKCRFYCRGGCRRSDGACDECMEGMYGTQCEKSCSVGCEDSRCSKEDGRCACKPGFSGDTCEKQSRIN